MAAASGSATILATNEYIIVAHTLGGVPTSILTQSKQDMGGKRVWVPAAFVDGTNFRIYIDSPDPFNAFAFFWYAEN